MSEYSPQRIGETGPEHRARLLREYVERQKREDPEGWERRVKIGRQISREHRDWYDLGGWQRSTPKDLGPATTYTVPAHGGIVGQDVFAGERRVVHRGMNRII